ncbi:MAG: hypothetical protein E5V53_10270, partial [Mesorhizobium sp.]
MRFLSVLLLIAGAAVGIFYPWAMSNFSGHAIGTYRVYEGGRFRPVTVQLAAVSVSTVRCWPATRS